MQAPICSQCGYDLTGAERRDGQYECPECGMRHESLATLQQPAWPGWRRALTRSSLPLVIILAGYLLWTLVLPGAIKASSRAGDLVFIVAFLVGPFLVLSAVPVGPIFAIWKVPLHRPDDVQGPTRGRFLVLAIILNIAIVVLAWVTLSHWALGEVVRMMPD